MRKPGSKPGGGEIGKGAQKLISSVMDEAALERVARECDLLPVLDRRRTAFKNQNELSTAFVGSIPTQEDFLGNTDFMLAFQAYMGLPPALLAPFVNSLRVDRSLLDAYGDKLDNARMVGDGWRARHDANKWNLFAILQSAHISASCEVLGAFSASLQQSEEFRGLDHNSRQGLVPDFKIELPGKPEALYELKCIGHSDLYFNTSTAETKCGGVAKRASKVHGEYVDKARRADREFNRFVSVNGSMGPMEIALSRFGVVRALVLGPRGEGSEDLIVLLRETAKAAAQKLWRKLGATSAEEARGHFVQRFFRSVGITAVREAAKIKRERLGFLLSATGTTFAASRQEAQRQFEQARREYCWQYGGVPRARDF